MTDQPLSPAAQAVRCDFAQIVRELQRRCQLSVSYTSTLPITVETNDASLQAVIDSLCGAVLRAAADQVVPDKCPPIEDFNEFDQGYAVAHITHRQALLAIAAELEGQ